jgi:hypothetical protein
MRSAWKQRAKVTYLAQRFAPHQAKVWKVIKEEERGGDKGMEAIKEEEIARRIFSFGRHFLFTRL